VEDAPGLRGRAEQRQRIELSDRYPGRDKAAARAERERIGFVRQPMTRWLDPGLLAAAAVEVAVSSAFGRLADKRESLVNATEPVDYSLGRDEHPVRHISRHAPARLFRGGR
jgi:hypothetical protein